MFWVNVSKIEVGAESTSFNAMRDSTGVNTVYIIKVCKFRDVNGQKQEHMHERNFNM